jgi:hypothetical protein
MRRAWGNGGDHTQKGRRASREARRRKFSSL